MPGPISLSLERKLPLLISTLLVGLTVGLTGAGYHEVRQASELRGIERLQRLTTQLAAISATSTEQRALALQRVATDPAVQRYLTLGDDSDPAVRSAALAALQRLVIGPTDSNLVAALRHVSEPTILATQPELPGDEAPVTALTSALATGGGMVTGEIFARNDSVFYLVGAPVSGNGRLLGYVLQRKTFRSGPRAQQQIRELTGNDSVTIYIASDHGPVWSTLNGRAVPVPALRERDGDVPTVLRYTRASGSEYVAAYARVPNTPIRLIAEMPYQSLLERPSTYLRRSAAVAAVMLIVGIFAAWVLSRRITRPLRDLTSAADAISTGNYGYRAPVHRHDETGRLADAFNTMAAQVQRSHDDLERQIEASRTLAERLADANRAKADFLATMSHELRTPLNAIGGYVDLLEFGVRGPVTAEQRRDLDRIRYNQRHLLTLIGNILDFTRLDARRVTYDITDVRVDDVVSDVAASVAPLLDEKNLRREFTGCDRPVVARADRSRLEQILLNLLSNSVRFTPTGGLITVAVTTRDDQVDVVVSDTGSGVPPEKLDAIFEPFVQVETGLTRTVGGTGLGLTISRTLARAMGGDLTADSDGATWARFTLTLPAGKQAAEESPSGVVAGVG